MIAETYDVLTGATPWPNELVIPDRPEILQERKLNALKWVNAIRSTRLSSRPVNEFPCGLIGIADDCVIARALGQEFWTNPEVGFTVVNFGDWQTIPMPEHVTQFVKDFDSGFYPELVERPA